MNAISELSRYENGWPTEIVMFYEMRYNGHRKLSYERPFIHEVENDINRTWYEMGLYDKYGHDYFGVSYRQFPDAWGDTAYSGIGTQIERENERVYTERD